MTPALRLAVGTLTVLRTGRVEVTPAVAARAMAVAPLAVLPVAVVAGVVAWAGGESRLPPLVVGLLTVTVLALGTRALHLDGLADVTDGLGAGWDRARALEVMRRGDIGPMGVVVLVLVLTGQAALIGTLARGWTGALLLVLLVCVSRCAVPLVCARGVPAARPDGLGAAVAGSVARWVVVLCWVLGSAVVAAAAVIAGAGPVAVLGGPVAAVAVLLLLSRCRRRFGGITGDVIGAGVEVAFTVLLLVVAVGTG